MLQARLEVLFKPPSEGFGEIILAAVVDIQIQVRTLILKLTYFSKFKGDGEEAKLDLSEHLKLKGNSQFQKQNKWKSLFVFLLKVEETAHEEKANPEDVK